MFSDRPCPADPASQRLKRSRPRDAAAADAPPLMAALAGLLGLMLFYSVI